MSDQTHGTAAEGRSLVQRALVTVINAFLVITAAVAAVPLCLGALAYIGSPSASLMDAVGGVTVIAMDMLRRLDFVLALLGIGAILVERGIPAVRFLPALVFVYFKGIGLVGAGDTVLDLYLLMYSHFLMLGAVAFAVVVNRFLSGHWFLSAEQLPVRTGSWFRTLFVWPATGFVVVALWAVPAAVHFVGSMESETGGYLQFASQGLRSREEVFRKGRSEVHLVGMLHIGERGFYEELYQSIPKDALILSEGVSDRGGILKVDLKYMRAARALGLESQGVFDELLYGLRVQGEAQRVELPKKLDPPRAAPMGTGPFVLNTDIDVAEMSPQTLHFLELSGNVFKSRSPLESIKRYVELRYGEIDFYAVWSDIIRLRDERVMAGLDNYAGRYERIYIPWGAAHMPHLEGSLRARGYLRVERKTRLVARYQTVADGILDYFGDDEMEPQR